MTDVPEARTAPPAAARLPWADLALALALVAWLGVSAYRARIVEAGLGGYLDCDGCLLRPVLAHDAWLLLALPLAFLAARWLRSRVLAVVLAAGVAALSAAFVVDVFVQRLLNRRVSPVDLGNYGDEFAGNWSVLKPLLATPEGATLAAASIALLVCAIAAIVAAPWAPRRRGAAAWSAVVAAIAVLSMLQGPMWYLNRWAFENVVQVNLGDGMRRMYGPETLQRLRDEPPPARVCETGLGRRMNVIVLVVESWSMHHSRLFSGLQDLTPRLDAIARRGSWYPRFRTNGFSTEGGLAALLTGSAPLSGIRYGTIMLFTEVEGDLHRRLRADGFDVRFLTTGGLDFTQRERWLELIGIDDVEGAEHPAYDGRQRGSFGAASDAALMQRVLQWYDHERSEAPFVATVLTVGMHAPFVPLDGAEPGENGAVRAADAAIGDFVDALDARGFFTDGLLFVSGDHRVMQPLTRGELERFGDDALIRVPAFVVGAGGTPPGPVDGDFQQLDLLPSLQYLLTSGEGCRSALHGRMFGPDPVPAPVQVFADPMRYDQLRVLAGGRPHLLVLDGDDSRWAGPAPPRGPIDPWLEVARLRVAKDKPPAE